MYTVFECLFVRGWLNNHPIIILYRLRMASFKEQAEQGSDNRQSQYSECVHCIASMYD